MKAAVCYEFGKPLVVEEVELDLVGKDEVKVRLAATAVCRSDMYALKGELGGKTPGVAGHESAGYVEQVGENVTSVKPGDPVVVSTSAGCGKCWYCTIGLPNLCESEKPSGGHLRNKQGQRLASIGGQGFAEYTIVNESHVVKVPREMPMYLVSLLACSVLTGFGAVVNRAKVMPLSSVVVIGCGGVGLNVIQGSVISGASPIIAIDVLDSKLELARAFGATHTFSARQEDVIKTVQQLTTRGAEYVFIAVGSADAVRQGFAMSGPRGMTVIIGATRKENLIFLGGDFLRGERVVTGTGMGSARLRIDIPRLVSLYQTGRLKLDELITGRYPLEQINEAIAFMETGNAVRNVIMF